MAHLHLLVIMLNWKEIGKLKFTRNRLKELLIMLKKELLLLHREEGPHLECKLLCKELQRQDLNIANLHLASQQIRIITVIHLLLLNIAKLLQQLNVQMPVMMLDVRLNKIY